MPHVARFWTIAAAGALFVAFTAEWFRREREGGHWDWIHPLAALGVRYHASDYHAQVRYQQVRTAAEAGLAVWHRQIPPGIKILYCVIAESGFPAAAIRQGPRLANWLKRSVLDIEAGFTAEDAVRQQSWRAGDTLVQALFEPAVALCRVISELRAGLPQVDPADAVQRLDSLRPNWRDELPFDLEEQDVRRLVEDLVRARRDEAGGLGVVRRLRRSDAGWSEYAELEITGALDHKKLPGSLRALLDDAGRVRLRPGGTLAEFGRAVAALERVQVDEVDQWEVRPLVQGFEALLPLGEELRLQVIAGTRQLLEFAAFGGEPLQGPVIALQPPDGTEIGESAELEVMGTSPVRSSHPWLVLAIEESAVSKLVFEHEPTDLGIVGKPPRRLLAFQGRAELDLYGERLVWRSGDEKQRALRLTLVGDTVWNIREQVFKSCPQAWLMDGDHGQLVARRELIWRVVGSSEWSDAAIRPPLGRVELAVRRKGELVAWSRASVVPSDFAATADAKTRTLRLSGLAGATVGASDPKPLVPRREGDATIVDLADHTRGASVRLILRWTSTIEMTLPDPITDPVLIDPNGKPAVHARLSVARISGYRLLAPQQCSLLFELRRKGVRPVHATRTVEGLAPLAAFGDLVRQLLGDSEDLDACVRLTWIGRGDWTAEVGWYEFDQPLTLAPNNNSSPFAILSKTAAPTLTAFSLASPKSGVDNPVFATEPEMRAWLQEHLGDGPWLLSGSTRDGRRLRPKVLGTGGTAGASPLLAACRKPSRGERDAALDVCLAQPCQLTAVDRRHMVDLCVTATKADVPYASVDVLRALCRTPRAAVFALAECGTLGERETVVRLQTELPMLWCATPIEEWIDAFGARRARLAHKLNEAGEPTAIAEASIANSLVQIVDLQPALRIHARAALMFMGGSARPEPAAVDRLCRPPDSDLGSLVQDLVRRHGDSDDPPNNLGLAGAVAARADLWMRHDGAYADMIAAPLVAAGLAMGELDRTVHFAACRAAWIYDRDYFENAILCALFKRAQASPVAAA